MNIGLWLGWGDNLPYQLYLTGLGNSSCPFNDAPGFCAAAAQTGALPKSGSGSGPADYMGGQVIWATSPLPTCTAPQ